MASIIQVGGKWRALIRRKGHPSYCQTFPTKAQAQAWARGIEADIDRGQALAPKAVLGRVVLVSDLIDTYRKLRGKSRPIADTSNEHYMLKTLARYLGPLDAAKLSPSDLVAYAEARKDEDGAGPVGRGHRNLRTAASMRSPIQRTFGTAQLLPSAL